MLKENFWKCMVDQMKVTEWAQITMQINYGVLLAPIELCAS